MDQTFDFEDLASDWTLFLDRDGVINERIVDGYVTSVTEFLFLPEAPHAVASLSNLFNRTIIVTNQQGIGKGLMEVDDLFEIHRSMELTIEKYGGKIDRIYFAGELATNDPLKMRKPGPGMALKAKSDFPAISFARSVMVGDSESDIKFGKELGMKTVQIGYERIYEDFPDHRFPSLNHFMEWLMSLK